MKLATLLLACTLIAVATAAYGVEAPSSLELTVERTAFGGKPWRLEVEGLRLELLLPSEPPAVGKGEGAAPGTPVQAGTEAPSTTTLLVHEASLAGAGDDAKAPFSLSGSLSRAGSEGALELTGDVGPIEAGGALLEQPLALRLEARGVDAEGLRQLLPPSWGISAASGLLDGDLRLTGRPAKVLAGDFSVDIEEGSLEYLGIQHRAPLHVESKLSFGEAPTRITDARIAAASAAFDDHTGTEFRAAFSYSESTLQLADLSFSMFGGTLQHQGEVHFGEVPSFDLASHLVGIDTGEVLGHTDSEPDPVLEWRSTLEGEWTGEEDWLSTLKGQVRMDAKGGLLRGSNVMRSVSAALLDRIPGIAKAGKSLAPIRTPLHHAGATFEVAGGTARTDDLRLVTGDYVVNAKGHVDADRTVDLEGRVALSIVGVGRVLSMVGFGLQSLVSVPVVPLRVTGTLEDPRFETDVSSLPLATWKLVPRTAGAARGMAEKGAGMVIDAAESAGRLLRPGRGEPKPEGKEGD